MFKYTLFALYCFAFQSSPNLFAMCTAAAPKIPICSKFDVTLFMYYHYRNTRTWTLHSFSYFSPIMATFSNTSKLTIYANWHTPQIWSNLVKLILLFLIIAPFYQSSFLQVHSIKVYTVEIRCRFVLYVLHAVRIISWRQNRSLLFFTLTYWKGLGKKCIANMPKINCIFKLNR